MPSGWLLGPKSQSHKPLFLLGVLLGLFASHKQVLDRLGLASIFRPTGRYTSRTYTGREMLTQAF